jgi:hypothetical protein
MELQREGLPWDAAFQAGKAHALYRSGKGSATELFRTSSSARTR